MPSPLRRRNGRKAACESCRRRKLACHHSHPICQRCQKYSFECVYREESTRTRQGNSDAAEQSPGRRSPVHPASAPSPSSYQAVERTPPMIDSPLEYLGPTSFTSVFIPDEQDCAGLFSKHVNPNDGWIRLAGSHASKRMWSAFRPNLLRRSKSDLIENSKTSLRTEQNPNAWLASFTYCRTHPSVTGVRALMAHLKHYVSLCIDICRRLGSVNVHFVYLLYKHNILEGILNGDKSFSCWTQHGELVAVTTSLGLHRELSADAEALTLQHELKRRVYSAVFNIDKVISTFTGRPPLLNQAYSSTRVPLDLSDDALLPDNFQSAAVELDAQVWSKNGQIYSTTILRSRTMFAHIRHKILELLGAMTDSLPEQSVNRVIKLKQETHETYMQLPSSIRFSKASVDRAEIPGHDLYAQILTRLEFLLNLFLLERLLTRHRIVTEQNLISVSQEMLDLSLIFWKKEDRFIGLYNDFDWLAMSYAVPSSGILCLELLRQAAHPQQYDLRLPRSVIIQDLSLLVAYLEWIQYTTSCGNVVASIRRILSRCLDQILDTPSGLNPPSQSVSLSLPDERALSEFSNLELLNTFDWMD
ncbi:hypothetical protein BO94DRAFT_607957 [Aspergillus sclerotioniger CBS 115572]|uniref:Zn(2)-C6 fungal-type domain-containing protein n=1 Tax=Aspergillus sclerotioniger CBS 115572 TaxID=1450535 RepID=A0A317VEZ8_9EURO|nr:hypothetical protein BO94DRAFT_607957 [Aspergillus sclerotioniger CBS 115572]PWY72465.1 hypothetical protein BO94DRAFT_607957 [Aspergillus sclerotioniger CBS 115572]